MPNESSSSVKVFSPRYTQAQVLDVLRTAIPQIATRLPVQWAVLFGSYVRGNYTAFSDIDLLVVYSGETREDAFAVVKKGIPLRGLEPHVLTQEEFRACLPVWKQMLRHSITIWGSCPVDGWEGS